MRPCRIGLLLDVQIMTVLGSGLALDEDPELISFDSVGELLDELDNAAHSQADSLSRSQPGCSWS